MVGGVPLLNADADVKEASCIDFMVTFIKKKLDESHIQSVVILWTRFSKLHLANLELAKDTIQCCL